MRLKFYIFVPVFLFVFVLNANAVIQNSGLDFQVKEKVYVSA